MRSEVVCVCVCVCVSVCVRACVNEGATRMTVTARPEYMPHTHTHTHTSQSASASQRFVNPKVWVPAGAMYQPSATLSWNRQCAIECVLVLRMCSLTIPAFCHFVLEQAMCYRMCFRTIECVLLLYQPSATCLGTGNVL